MRPSVGFSLLYKKAPRDAGLEPLCLLTSSEIFALAEAQGFEPWKPFGLPVFKTGAIDHSAKLPIRKV